MIKRIIRHMIYVFRMRRMVATVLEVYAKTPRDPWRGTSYPTRRACLRAFKKKYPKYTPQLGQMVLTIAANDGYLRVIKPKNNLPGIPVHTDEDNIAVTGEGVKLLTPTGFINALAGAIGKITPIIAVFVSVVALIVSIYVATSGGKIKP